MLEAFERMYERHRQDAIDAARWRWLRDRHDGGSETWFVYGAETDGLNASIDAAISEGAQ